MERIVVHDQIGGIALPEGPVWEAALVEQLEKQRTFLEKMREGSKRFLMKNITLPRFLHFRGN
ncbi:hypothetical protein JCM19047_2895 [Bacillus sp. JCM 19047]|nr:hypothetical protein JCM19047_2895 [Bacillus sp. JCM 19047]